MIPSWFRWVLGGAAVLVGSFGCTSEPEERDEMQRLIRQLEPLHQRLGEPRPGDWLASRDEPGQTYKEYRRTRVTRPIGKRNTIYVQPLGEMSAKQSDIVERTARFLEIYFDSPVKLREPMSLAKIPAFAEREAKGFGKQLRATWVLRDVLFHNLPEDAAVYLALTPRDLWDGSDGDQVLYGQADHRGRVAVWSMARHGDPEKDYTRVLRRLIKTATHETGHVFSMSHCTRWECNMGGSKTQEEADRHPLALCPECLAKVCWACTARPRRRFADLAALCKTYGLEAEAEFFARSLRALPVAK